jgi:ABC-type proline/glycine betaine transport system permease subunit
MTASALDRSPVLKVASTLRAILDWIGIPLVLTIVVILLYNQVIYRIDPGTMTYRAIFDDAGNPSKLTRYVVYHVEAVFVSGFVAMLTAIPAGVLITREGFRDFSVIESARGMGMTKRQILFRIELPLALNVIAAGVRTSMVINVGTAALTTFIGWPSLGHLMAAGLRVARFDMVAIAAVLTAVFAIGLDFVMGKVQIALAPRGV